MFKRPGLHHRLLTYSASTPPLCLLQALVSLSALTVLKSGSSTLASGMLAVIHVSVKHSKLHNLKVLTFFISTASSSILFGSEFTFPMIIEGTGGLNLHFFASRLAFSIAPALQPQYGFLTSPGKHGTTPMRDFALKAVKSCSNKRVSTWKNPYP